MKASSAPDVVIQNMRNCNIAKLRKQMIKLTLADPDAYEKFAKVFAKSKKPLTSKPI